MNFSDNLKRLRKEKKLNQSDLAAYFGIGRTAVTSWENGSTIPNIEVLDKLADIFDISTDDLLGRKPAIDRYKRNADTLRLLECYEKLNDIGKREAIKRVAELNMIPQYSAVEMAIAAHADKIDDKELELMRQDIDEL